MRPVHSSHRRRSTRPFRALGLAVLAATATLASGEPLPSRSEVLAEGWRFQPDPNRVGDEEGWQRPALDRRGWRPVTVPMAWDHYDPVMDGYEGVGWYALELGVDRLVPAAWQRLRFGRANYQATVWVDGHEAGRNRNGYLPFEIALSPWLVPGRPVWVVVRVENGVRYDWLPGTTTVEWVQYGGLLQPVELFTTPRAYVGHASIRATPSGTDGRVTARVEVVNTAETPFAGRVRLEAGDQAAEIAARVEAKTTASVDLEVLLPRARSWSPESPALYDSRVRLLTAEGELDSIHDRFGVRSIEAHGRQLLLNGRPLRIRGVNRYDELPRRGPVADEAAIRSDLESVKGMGANLVRAHYPQDPAHLRIADEIGLLYMEEVPLNWWRASFVPPLPPEFENDRIVDAAETALEEMVRRDGNHPSLVIWSMANECGTADELGIRSMERLLRRAKALDPTRLATYVATGKFEENRAFALADLVAVNLYFGMFQAPLARDRSEVEERVYAPTRRRLEELARFFADKPIVVSEFGTIGIPGAGGDMRFSEDYQAAYVSAAWRALAAVPEVSGGVVWCWADYRHRAGFTNDFPTFFGPFGLVTFERRPKKVLEALRALWAGEAQGR